jgi:hypothetical protein
MTKIDQLLEETGILPESPIGIVVGALMSHTTHLEKRLSELEQRVQDDAGVLQFQTTRIAQLEAALNALVQRGFGE